ncbi:hypothetical protein GGS20DRAFT_231372 [Poronia punctata]|nr:hypothetical protein GGS20DRAFT_231372 [Poronia punctata]
MPSSSNHRSSGYSSVPHGYGTTRRSSHSENFGSSSIPSGYGSTRRSSCSVTSGSNSSSSGYGSYRPPSYSGRYESSPPPSSTGRSGSSSPPYSGRSRHSPPPSSYKPPRRTPTNSSYYDFDGIGSIRDVPSATWMYARDARAQQAGLAPDAIRRNRKDTQYPSVFRNATGLPLTTPGNLDADQKPLWAHHPLIPGQTTTYIDKATHGTAGGVRSAYTLGNPKDFDVIYHDPRRPTRGRHAEFSLAPYIPKA